MNEENKYEAAVQEKNVSTTTRIFPFFVKYWLPVIFLLGLIFWLSGAPFTFGHTSEFIFPILYFLFPRLSPEEACRILELIRAFAHMVEFFLLGLLLSRFFYRYSSQTWNLKWSALIMLLVALFALGDEFHQSFVPLRKASFLDVILDLTGGFFSQIVMMRIKKV